MRPEQLARVAAQRRSQGNIGVAYTYNEPMIWFEYVMACAPLIAAEGMVNVLVTNGIIEPDPLEELLPHIDAMNVDIKSIKEDFYKKYCRAKLIPVLENIKTAKKKKVHIEITNLVIPTLNDSKENFEKLVDWIADNTGVDTPLHFSRYFPCYKFSLPSTPISTLKLAKEIADKRLKYVYLGNV